MTLGAISHRDAKASAQTLPDALTGLRTIEHSDRALFTDAVAQLGHASWSHYFPYLQLFGQSSGKERLFMERVQDALVVYRYRVRQDRAVLTLLMPPFPWNETALHWGLERCAAFNQDERGQIARVSEAEAAQVARLGLELRFNGEEYVYDRPAVAEMAGKRFATLRRKVSLLNRLEVQVRPYAPADEAAGKALLKRWLQGMKDRNIGIGPYKRYAKLCLEQCDAFGDMLYGEVTEVEGAMAAFTFGGPISATTGSVFVTVSDHAHPGLAYLQRVSLLRAFPDLPLFNDGTDTKRAGMAQMKNTFRPLRKATLLSARMMP